MIIIIIHMFKPSIYQKTITNKQNNRKRTTLQLILIIREARSLYTNNIYYLLFIHIPTKEAHK